MRRIAIALVVLGLMTSTLAAPAAAAPIPVGSVSGVVTTTAGPLPSGTLRVLAYTVGYNAAGASGAYGPVPVDPVTGAYSFASLATGTYRFTLEYLGSENFVRDTDVPARPIVEGSQNVDFRLAAGATISGTLTTSDGTTFPAFTPGLVRVVDSAGDIVTAGSFPFDPATGQYSISRIPPGDWTVEFGAFQSEWVSQFWNSATEVSGATLIRVDEGSTVTGIDAVLQRRPVIRGTLTFEGSGNPASGRVIDIRQPGDSFPATSPLTNTAGEFTSNPLDPGEYTVCVGGGGGDLVRQCWNDGAPVTLAPDQVLEIDWTIVESGQISGTVSYFDPALGALTGAYGTIVALYRLNEPDGTYELFDQTQVPEGWSGFSFPAVPPGTYAVQFFARSVFQQEVPLNSEYWEDARYWAERTDEDIAPGEVWNLGDVVLSPRSLDISRIDGQDRFEVGVSVSQTLYPDDALPVEGVPVVYVASGFNFPDALTAGPAAALDDGVVLLVRPDAIPAAVAEELGRLRPQRIVVAGGPASVSPAVFDDLSRFVPSSSDVVRANGVDRYEASRAVVRGAFSETGSDVAIISTGANFPDALSAGPAAASQEAPVILVNGSASSIDSATRDLLDDLNVTSVYIAGGTASVSTGIESSLKSLLGSANVERFAGADRFEVGVLISQEFFPSAEYTFVATGYKFPDALTGGPLAAAFGGPLYLSPPECLPADVAFDILDLDAQSITLLGGPASLTPAIESLQLC